MNTDFGWREAKLAVLRGDSWRRPHDHRDAFLECPCSVCRRLRADADKFGFNAAGKIAYEKRKVRQPWEVAA